MLYDVIAITTSGQEILLVTNVTEAEGTLCVANWHLLGSDAWMV